MDPSVRKQILENARRFLRDASKQRDQRDMTAARKSLVQAKNTLLHLQKLNEKPPASLVNQVEVALRSLDEELLKKKEKKKKPCSYRKLNDREIQKLKANCHDPEEIKGFDPKLDLFKCQGSGKVAVGWKPFHQDDEGDWQPGGDDFDDTCINIDELPWPTKGKRRAIMDELRIEFRIGGLQRSLDDILEKLPLAPDRVHRKGERRGKTILTHRDDWFVYSAGDTTKAGFEKSVVGLVERLHAVRQKLQKACGPHTARLSCILYMAANHRPIVYFAAEVLEKLNDLGAAIDLDLYVFPSEANDESDD